MNDCILPTRLQLGQIGLWLHHILFDEVLEDPEGKTVVRIHLALPIHLEVPQPVSRLELAGQAALRQVTQPVVVTLDPERSAEYLEALDDLGITLSQGPAAPDEGEEDDEEEQEPAPVRPGGRNGIRKA